MALSLLSFIASDFLGVKGMLGDILNLVQHPRIPFFRLALEEITINPITLLIIAALFLAFAALRNYSKIMPSRLNLDAKFDEPGLRKLVEQLPKSVLKDFPIPPDWAEKQGDFFNRVDDKFIKENLDLSFSNREDLHGNGYATFRLERCPGFQTVLSDKNEPVSFLQQS